MSEIELIAAQFARICVLHDGQLESVNYLAELRGFMEREHPEAWMAWQQHYQWTHSPDTGSK
jgi:hypothetical protein